MTGSVNQAAVESGLGEGGKRLLAQAGIADVAMAPAADMFELGVKVQVLKRGTMFAPRAERLFALYQRYASLEALPAEERDRLEKEILRLPVEEVWEQTRTFWREREPAQLARAERDPHHRMALVFPLVPGPGQPLGHPRRGRAPLRLPDLDRPRHRGLQRLGQGQLPRGPRPPRRRADRPQLLEGAAVLTRAQALRAAGRPAGTGRLRLPPSPALLRGANSWKPGMHGPRCKDEAQTRSRSTVDSQQ
jgi:hypothetical protein